MNRRTVIAAVLALIMLALLAASVAADTPTTIQVGLVVAFPDGSVHTEIVKAPSTATTFDILLAANLKVVSESTQYGPAICSINDTGCPATNCFCDAAHYWAYYHQDAATGKWVVAQEGAGSFVPANHAVEGFAWSGVDANYNPTTQPPARTYQQIVDETSPKPVAVPEPATIMLFAGGISGLAGYLYRKRAR